MRKEYNVPIDKLSLLILIHAKIAISTKEVSHFKPSQTFGVDLIPALTTPYPKNRRHISSSPTVNVNNVLQVLFQKLHHLYRYTVLVVLALTPTTISQPVTDASNTEI